MDKLELAQKILTYLYEQHPITREISDIQTALDQQSKESLTKEDVTQAVDYLEDRNLVQGNRSWGSSLLRISISPQGQDIIDSDSSLHQYIQNSVNNNATTNIHGSVTQFVQGNHNTINQTNEASAESLFAELLDFLKQNGGSELAVQAEEEKKQNGIKAALSTISVESLKQFTGALATQVMQHVTAITSHLT